MARRFFAELHRRNVLRAGAFYAAAVWALAQGIAQLAPFFGAPDWTVRWFVIAAVIGFPFWMAFAWFYEFTPQGLKRESDIAPGDSIAHSTGRKLDKWIIAVLALAVVLLLTNSLVWHTQSGPAGAADPGLATIVQKSVAVLPLTNESGDKDQQYFSDGLSEDLITALSQFAGLKVISRNSSFQFRNSKDDSRIIGTKLGVAHLLEGSVRRLGNEVRISAELVNAEDGSTVWSQHYDRPYRDLFALQDDITRSVASALQARLLGTRGAVVQSDRPPSGSLDAYTAYLQGQFHDGGNTTADDLKAIDYYNEAIRLDPKYAAAYAALSHVWTGHAAQSLSGAAMEQGYDHARSAADSALALDPTLASAHLARAYVLQSADFDWSGADAEFQRALQLAPEDGAARFMWGVLQATLGKPSQAAKLTREALVSDPLHANWYNWLAQYLWGLGRGDEAKAAIGKAIAFKPGAESYHETLATIEILRGDVPAALAAAQREPPGLWREMALALARQMAPDKAAADAALKTLVDGHAGDAAYQIAEVQALRRDPDQMFNWLERARSNQDPGISSLLFDPFLLRYKDDPRFAAFCKKVGLPTTTEAKPMP